MAGTLEHLADPRTDERREPPTESAALEVFLHRQDPGRSEKVSRQYGSAYLSAAT